MAACSNANGVVPLLNSIANPALSGADPLAASATGQLGTARGRSPAGSLPDIGAIEINQPLSTTASANNDVLTGQRRRQHPQRPRATTTSRAWAATTRSTAATAPTCSTAAPATTSSTATAASTWCSTPAATKVAVDLSLATDTAKRGSETDTLTSIEGAIGSSAADTFQGDQFNNYFQGGLGKDTFTGGGGRDLYDFNAVAESGVGRPSGT